MKDLHVKSGDDVEFDLTPKNVHLGCNGLLAYGYDGEWVTPIFKSLAEKDEFVRLQLAMWEDWSTTGKWEIRP